MSGILIAVLVIHMLLTRSVREDWLSICFKYFVRVSHLCFTQSIFSVFRVSFHILSHETRLKKYLSEEAKQT